MKVWAVLLFLLYFHQSKSQSSYTPEVWNRFYELVKLPASEQVVGFRSLQMDCIQKNITTDSTYSNLLFLYATAQFADQRVDSAISLLKEAIQVGTDYPQKNPTQYLAKYYFYLAYYQTHEDKFEIAVKNYHKAYDLGIRTFNKWGIPSLACQNLAHLYYDIGDYEHGLKYASLGVQLDIAHQNPNNLIKNLYEQCINLYELDRLSETRSKMDSLITLAEYHSDSYEKGLIYNLLGKISADQKKYEKAESAFLKAIRLFNESQSTEQVSVNYVALQYLSLLKGNPDKSLFYERLAYQNTHNPFTLSVLFANKAQYHKYKNEYDKALENVQQAIKILPISFETSTIEKNPTPQQLKKLSQKEYAFMPLLDKAEILSLNKNKLKDALTTYLLLDTLVDYMRWQHQGMASKLFWREKLTMLYEQAIETSYRLNDKASAFYFMEKSRAVLLLDQLNNIAAKNFLPKAEAEREAALRMQVSQHQNEGAQYPLSAFLQSQAKLDEYVKDLERKHPRYYEYKYNNHVPSLMEVQQYLANGEQSLLNYYEGKDGIYVFVANAGNSYLKKIDAAPYYEKKAELMFYFAADGKLNRQYQQYLQASSSFYQLFLAPFENYLTSRVVVSTSGSLIPFAALSTSPKKADYLVHRHAFSYTYSTRALLNDKKMPSSAEGETFFLGIAPVAFPYKSNLAGLTASANALSDNGKLFRSSILLIGKKANKSAFEAQWPRAKVVQLISHAYADQETAQPTLYFADRGLSLRDLHQEARQTQLLVLSACRTSIGKDYKGEGVFSLSRGFMARGVPSIYSTLWDVNDRDAYSLSHKILGKAKKQIPLDIALQETQLEWLTSADRSKQLPNAWAGIILLGSNAPLPEEPGQGTWVWYVLILSAVLTFGTWWWSKQQK